MDYALGNLVTTGKPLTNIHLNHDTHMYTYIHIFKLTSYISYMTRSPSYIISLLRTELLKYSFIFIVVSHYEYGVCENECVSVWMSGRGGEGVCVEVEGVSG